MNNKNIILNKLLQRKEHLWINKPDGWQMRIVEDEFVINMIKSIWR